MKEGQKISYWDLTDKYRPLVFPDSTIYDEHGITCLGETRYEYWYNHRTKEVEKVREVDRISAARGRVETKKVDMRKTVKKSGLMKKFEEETGKHAVWRGRVTKQYKEWLNEVRAMQ